MLFFLIPFEEHYVKYHQSAVRSLPSYWKRYRIGLEAEYKHSILMLILLCV